MRTTAPIGTFLERPSGFRRLLLAASLAAAAWLAGCTSAPVAPPGSREPLRSLAVVVDTDVIGSAFADYHASGPQGTGDYQGFVRHFVDALRDEARGAGVNAGVEALSLKSLAGDFTSRWQGRPVLVVRASRYTVRKEQAGGRDLGWNGDTAWEFRLFEQTEPGRYGTRWSAALDNENLNPALCGSYRRCGRTLAGRVFAQMRGGGLLP